MAEHDELIGYARNLGASHEDAEDAAQFAEQKAVENGIVGVQWKMKTTRNRIYDLFRQKQRRPVHFPLETSPQPFAFTEGIEERDEVQTLLSSLTDLQRQAIEKHYLHGLQYNEIAEELGIPENTVKSRVHNGLTELKKRYQPRA